MIYLNSNFLTVLYNADFSKLRKNKVYDDYRFRAFHLVYFVVGFSFLIFNILYFRSLKGLPVVIFLVTRVSYIVLVNISLIIVFLNIPCFIEANR